MKTPQVLWPGENLAQFVTDSAPVLIWMSGTDGGYNYFNQPWLEFTGHQLEQELGNGWLEGVHPEDRAGYRAAYLSAFNTSQKFQAEYRLQRADGTYRWILNNGVPRFNLDGSFAGYIGSCIDITERKQAEERLRLQQQQFKMLVESMPDIVTRVDRQGQHLYFNPAIKQIVDVAPESLVGKTPVEFGISPEIDQDWKEIVNKVFETGQEQIFEAEQQTAAGLRYYQARLFPEYDRDGAVQYVVSIARDITELVTAQKELAVRVRQQAAVAELGLLALAETDPVELIQQVVITVAQTLRLDYCSATELILDKTYLQIKAGFGWEEGIIGQAKIKIEPGNWLDHTLQTPYPVIVSCWADETRFTTPELLAQHGVSSSLSTRIEGLQRQPFGTLVGHSIKPHKFSRDDVNFFQSAANVLSAAIQRHQTEKALQDSEQRYRDLADSMPLLVWVDRPGEGTIYCNQRWFEYTGASFEQLRGAGWKALVHPDDLAVMEERARQAVEQHQPFESEYRLRRADGIYRWQLVRARPMGEPQNQFEFWVGTNTDIDDQKRAEETQSLLAKVSQLLVHSRDYRLMLLELARLIVPQLAEWCAIDVIEEDETIKRLAAAHSQPEKEALIYRLRELLPLELTQIHPVTRVMQAGRGRIYTSEVDFKPRNLTSNSEYLQIGEQLGFQSVMIIPLFARGQILGTISFVRNGPHRAYSPAELALAETLTQRTAIALDNARLYEAERLARAEAETAQRRLAFLAEASRILAASLDYEVTLRSVAQLVVPRLADWCVVTTLGEKDQSQHLTVVHNNPNMVAQWKELEQRYPLISTKTGQAIQQAIRSGQPMLFTEISDIMLAEATHNTEHLEILRSFRLKSFMAVPLSVRGRTIGAISLLTADDSGRHLDQPELALAQELATRVALAIDNARLYQEAQQAIEAQKEVDYLKNLFMSLASHELRSPLTTVRGYAQMVQRSLTRQLTETVDKSQQKTIERNLRSLESILRQSDQMNELIKQLLDISRLQNDQFELHYSSAVDLLELAQRVVEQQQTAGSEHNLVIQTDLKTLSGEWDEARLEQVLNNLVSNALKYSSAGTTVTIGLEQALNEGQPTQAVVWVRDQGVGIKLEEQAQVFERFYRARSGKRHGAEGLGLGLYISHEIVIRHGGRMWFESQPEQGSTFYFSLPLVLPSLSDEK
jgi:PAS domain S-box-containing protein